MKDNTVCEIRVLAIDPANKGFGFAILEGPDSLVDWGVKQTEVSKDPGSRVLNFVHDLIEHYEPDLVVAEDYKAKGFRRGPQARELMNNATELAAKRGIRTVYVSQLALKRTFGVANKHELAQAIANRFPELAPRLFPYRKTWMSEDHRAPILDAVAFALTFRQKKSKHYNAA